MVEGVLEKMPAGRRPTSALASERVQGELGRQDVMRMERTYQPSTMRELDWGRLPCAAATWRLEGTEIVGDGWTGDEGIHALEREHGMHAGGEEYVKISMPHEGAALPNVLQHHAAAAASTGRLL